MNIQKMREYKSHTKLKKATFHEDFTPRTKDQIAFVNNIALLKLKDTLTLSEKKNYYLINNVCLPKKTQLIKIMSPQQFLVGVQSISCWIITELYKKKSSEYILLVNTNTIKLVMKYYD